MTDIQGTKQPEGKSFYFTHKNYDGTVDVYLCPGVENGNNSGNNYIAVRVVKGVEPFDGMEEDIRRRYSAWYDSGENIL